MEAAQTEPLECDSYATDFPASETKNHDSLLASTEAEALDCPECVSATATSGNMQGGRVTPIQMGLVQSAGITNEPGDTGSTFFGSISAGDDGDVQVVGSSSVSALAVVEKSEIFEGNSPDDVKIIASKQDTTTITSSKVEGFDCTTIKDDPRVSPTTQGNSTLSPRGLGIDDKVTNASHEDSKDVARALGSGACMNQTPIFSGTVVSNQGKALAVTATNKRESGKYEDITFHGLEENQVAEDAYDMDFDIFDEDHCMFPPLDADKTEPWHPAVVDGVIMEENTAPLHKNQHFDDIERAPVPEESNKESGAVDAVKENPARREDWLHDTQQKSCSKPVQMDSHNVEENMAINNTDVQVNEPDAGNLGHEADVPALSERVQDKELVSKTPEIENCSDIEGQSVADDVLASLEVKHRESTKDARSCKTKRLEEEFNITFKGDFESASVSQNHGDDTADLHELDQEMHCDKSVYKFASADPNPASEDSELHTEAACLLEGTILVSDTGLERGIATQIDAQGKLLGQDSECVNLVNKYESVDVKYSKSNVTDQWMDKTNASPIHCLGVCRNDSSLNVAQHMEAEGLLEDANRQSSSGEEGIRNQIEVQGKVTCPDIVNLDLAKKEDSVDLNSGGSDAIDQLVNTSNTSAIYCSGTLSADSSALALSDMAEPEQQLKTCEQKESISLTVCGERPLEALSEPSAQLKVDNVEQNAMLEELAVHNNEMQDSDGVLSTLLNIKRSLENQGDELGVKEGESNPTFVSDGLGFVVTSNDVEDSREIGNGGKDIVKDAHQEAKATSTEDDSAKESNNSEMKEVHVKEDKLVQDKVVEARIEPLNKEAYGKTSNEDFEEVDGGYVGACHGDENRIFDMRDGSTEDQSAVTEHEIEALNQVKENNSMMQPSCTTLPGAERAAEGKNQELPDKASYCLPDSPYVEIDMSSRTELVEKARLSDGPDNNRKFTALKQNAVPVEPTGVGRRAADSALSKKHSKRLKTDERNSKSDVLNKDDFSVFKEAHECVHVGDHIDAKSQSEQGDDSDSSLKDISNPMKQGFAFGIGDLVWAKVKSHPWWPAQIFDPADASKSARKAKKAGRVLVAFFGDCTFAWLQQSQLIPFRPNFEEKAQQTTMRIFCLAVEEALEELCRRSEKGLSCEHFKGSLHSTSSFPQANTGIREGVRVGRLKDLCESVEMFMPKITLNFVKSIAAAPLGEWSSTLQWAESRGYAYGLRTCMVALQGPESAPVLPMPPALSSQELKLKRSHGSLSEALPDTESNGKGSKKRKKIKSDKDRKKSKVKGALAGAVSEQSKELSSGIDIQMRSDMRDSAEFVEGNKPKNIIKIKLSKLSKSNQLASSEKNLITQSDAEGSKEQNLDDGRETLLAIAGHSSKVFKRPSSKESKISTSLKRVRKQIDEESQEDRNTRKAVKANPKKGLSDTGDEASLTTKIDTNDPFGMPPSPSLRDGVRIVGDSNASVEIGLKREQPMKDSAGKSASARKFSKVGDSIRRVASELKGTPVVKGVDDSRSAGLELKKIANDGGQSEMQTSPMGSRGLSKESPEDVSLLQLRRDLELLAKNAGSGGAKGRAGEQSKRGDQVEVEPAKSLPQWQSVPQRSQRSCVQELALAARKRKSEIVLDEDLSSKLPREESTISSQQSHRSKAYRTSSERVAERRCYDRSLLLYSRRPPPPDLSIKSSSQRYNERLSSHAPLGLFMKFPQDFPLPSEAQLKAAFIPFGPLQMSATRLYKDSASAQVVFKHGRDAESALKHAKKNPIFGQVAVTYRLRHLSHSTRVQIKADTFLSSKGQLAQTGVLRRSAPSRENRAGASEFPERRDGNKETVSSPILSSRYPDSQSVPEPSGDIQDQMMTLLRQVSVIVNTSPVTSDGT